MNYCFEQRNSMTPAPKPPRTWNAQDVISFTFTCPHYCVDTYAGVGDVWVEAVFAGDDVTRKLQFYKDGTIAVHHVDCKGKLLRVASVPPTEKVWWEALGVVKVKREAAW